MRKYLIITFFIALLGFMFSSCITPRKVNYLQNPNLQVPAYIDTVSYEEYQLRVGDCLYIKVSTLNSDIDIVLNDGMRENQHQVIINGTSAAMDLYTYTVKPNGTINFPLIDTVFVKGKTTREVKEVMEQKISVFTSSCTVDVRTVKRFFSIIGAGTSGRYPIQKEKMSIFEALAMAGDIDLYGDRSKVRIVRETEVGTEVKMFDIRSVDMLHSEFYYIEPNDVIYIQAVREQFFSMSNLPAVLTTTMSTLSFGFLIYNYFLAPKN